MKALALALSVLAAGLAECAETVVLDFGELQPRTETTRRVKIANDGTNALLVASIVCDSGVRATISRDCIFAAEKMSLNVTVTTGEAAGDFEASAELRVIGMHEAWRKLIVKGSVVDGAVSGSVLPAGTSREIWKCADDAALLERSSFGDSWRKVFDENIARLKVYGISERDKYVSIRLASRALKEACDAADDEWATQYKIPKPLYNYGSCQLDGDAVAAHDAMMARINERARKKREANEKQIAEYKAREVERRRREALEQKEHDERMRRQNEAFAAQQRAKKESEDRERAAAHWNPPEYFSEEFFYNVWMIFLVKELHIPDNEHGQGYRDVLLQGFSAYRHESSNPFREACDIIKTNNVWNIDRRCRCGRELHECFTQLFGGGGKMQVKVSKEGESEKWVRGNICAAMSAWKDRRGELWRMLGYLWRPMYCSGDASWKQSVDMELADGFGEKGVSAAVAWCKALAKENPDDDTWQKCAYPLLKSALAPRPEILAEFLKGVEGFLGAESWLAKELNSASGSP